MAHDRILLDRTATLINTPLQGFSGVSGGRWGALNRFSGFVTMRRGIPGLKTAEAVAKIELRADTPLKRGVNQSGCESTDVSHILLIGIGWKSGYPKNSVVRPRQW